MKKTGCSGPGIVETVAALGRTEYLFIAGRGLPIIEAQTTLTPPPAA